MEPHSLSEGHLEEDPGQGVAAPGSNTEVSIRFEENDLTAIRHELHRYPELSGREAGTSARMIELLRETSPDTILTDLGGHGAAAVYRGEPAAPRLLFRCDIDALPIDETITLPYGSNIPGVSHKCGHDGHSAILIGLARRLTALPAGRSTVILLFQPGEETGEGAADVIRDSRFQELRPDLVFALHNLPGFPEGSVIVRDGTFASASRGMIVRYRGSTSHAAEPHRGRSPAAAVAHLVLALEGLPQSETGMDTGSKVTVIHLSAGEEEAFGTSPGSGTVMATLRGHGKDPMERLSRRAEELAGSMAGAFGLESSIEWTQEFPVTVNSKQAAATVRRAASRLGMEVIDPGAPFPWSEDFGHFTSEYSGALFGLGAGPDHPALHSPEYDFPDSLINPGVELCLGMIEDHSVERV